jgi:hypothetical protein
MLSCSMITAAAHPCASKRVVRPIETPESAVPPIGDVSLHATKRRYGPCVDGSGLARRIFTLQQWSEQPCVRPVCAVLMTAGHNALRRSGPYHKHAFEDALARCGLS